MERALKKVRRPLALMLLIASGLLRSAHAAEDRPEAAMEEALHAAEAGLRTGDRGAAASHFREVLREGWRLSGWLDVADGRAAEAQEAFRHAGDSAAEGAPATKDPLLALAAPERSTLRRRVRSVLAQSYLNLGILQAQDEHFAEAADLLEQAARVDAEFPQVQYALGVAHFNARSYDRAREPLRRALAARPDDGRLRRMLAMASFNTEAYAETAELLREDPERDRDPSLQYAYGLALVRSNHAALAEGIFAQLVAAHGDSAEVHVILGEAHAQQGDFDAAIASLRGAIRRKPDVAEAHAALGVIYLKQGHLAEAEGALRAELRVRPDDPRARSTLASVLDLEGRPEEALEVLGPVLRERPDFKDARYLAGKILLSRGGAAEAVAHLEAARGLAPDDASVRYQLGRAYQALGRPEQARRELEAYRDLKEKRRGTP